MWRGVQCGVSLGMVLVLAGCASPARREGEKPAPSSQEPLAEREDVVTSPTSAATPLQGAADVVQLAPGIRVDRVRGEVLVDASVPIDASKPERRVYLEVLVCSPNTREHETLLVTPVSASLVHAGLLLLGLEAGRTGRWSFEGMQAVPAGPEGPEVEVLVRREVDGAAREEPLSSWVVDVRSGANVMAAHPQSMWVFAGSRFRRAGEGRETSAYEADREGTIVGLSTFGTETVAWTQMHHPDTSVEAPAYIADPARTPTAGTRVTLVLRPARAGQ